MSLTPAHRAAALPFRLAARGLAAPTALKLGAAISFAWLFLAVAAPLVAPYDPIAQDLEQTLRHPSLAHWLGTDNFGRDVLTRIIWGARLDLAMGLLGVIVPFILGSAVGLVAGYFGGIVDTLLMRLLDITISFPFFVLVIAIISVLGAGLVSFFIAVSLVGWVSYARLIRGQTSCSNIATSCSPPAIWAMAGCASWRGTSCPMPCCRRSCSPCPTWC